MCSKAVLLMFSAAINLCSGARILGVVTTPSYSHQIVFQPIWRELSLRGHQVIVLTTDPQQNKSLTNLTEIDLRFSYKILQDELPKLIESENTFIGKLRDHFAVYDKIVDSQLEHPEVQQLMKNESEHFDILLVEVIHPTVLAFSKRFKCPYILLSSLDGYNFFYNVVGSTQHPAMYPMPLVETEVDTATMTGRMFTLAINIMSTLLFNYITGSMDFVTKKHFGDVNSYDLLQNYSMLFINSDPIFHPVKPLVPAIVMIGGGVQIHQEKPLPTDLKKILDDSKDIGVIYFSLGSNVNSKDLPERILKIILEAFAEIPYKVLWKYELDDLPNKPENVLISKWYPQQDILRHPSVKLFITHGGLQSLDETIHFQVPIVGMPVFADQHYNIARMINKGVGLRVNHKTMTKDEFKSAILEVLSNSKYRERMVELSNLVKDEPMTGLEKAVWWTEYTIRHKGAHHLRSPTANLSFVEYYLLDIIGCFALILMVLVYTIFWLSKKILLLVKKITTKSKIKSQ